MIRISRALVCVCVRACVCVCVCVCVRACVRVFCFILATLSNLESVVITKYIAFFAFVLVNHKLWRGDTGKDWNHAICEW